MNRKRFAAFVSYLWIAVCPALPAVDLWVAPDSCKVNPRNGNVLEEHYFHGDPAFNIPKYVRTKMERAGVETLPYYASDSYDGPPSGTFRRTNPVWDTAAKRVRLRGSANEFVSFQVVIENSKPDTPVEVGSIAVTGWKGPAAFDAHNIQFFRERYMEAPRSVEDLNTMKGPQGPKFWYPDVLVPLTVQGQLPFRIPDAGFGIPGQSNQTVWVDLYIPHRQRPGRYTASIRVLSDGKLNRLGLELEVLPLALPDKLNFRVDMMATPRPIAAAWGLNLREKQDYARYLELEEKFYRLFEEHRCTLNMFPGSPSTPQRTAAQVIVPGFAPALAGQGPEIHVMDWSEYDRHFARYYSGEAFKDLPRGRTPVTHAFLPFSLGWPSALSQYFSDRKTYETELKQVLREFAAHFEQKGWTETQFQIFLNGKRRFGEPWDTDEPTRKDDYAALRYYGEMIREVLGPRDRRKVNIAFRVDIGTPQKMVGELDDVCDLRNVNYEAYNEYMFHQSEFRRRQEQTGEIWWYYAEDRANQRWTRVDFAMASNFLWAWAMWDLDVRTCCKWDCLNYSIQDPLNRLTWDWNYVVFAYPGRQLGYDGPLPSMRLKSFRQGLQDMEYLELLARRDGNRARAGAILQKYYTSWNRRTRQPLKPGSVRVGPEAPYRLRADIVAALRP